MGFNRYRPQDLGVIKGSFIVNKQNAKKLKNSISFINTVRNSLAECRPVLDREVVGGRVDDVLKSNIMLLDKVMCDLSGVLLDG